MGLLGSRMKYESGGFWVDRDDPRLVRGSGGQKLMYLEMEVASKHELEMVVLAHKKGLAEGRAVGISEARHEMRTALGM